MQGVGAYERAKILVESTYEIIEESFRSGDQTKLTPGPLKMTMRFWWGKKTFDPRDEVRR
jgi:hypothetical protein